MSLLHPDRCPPPSEDILTLRRLVADLAGRCGIDLADRTAIRQLVDGDFNRCGAAPLYLYKELSDMLVLLYRLEDSSSEDIGLDGLQRLWLRYREAIAGFRAKESLAT